MATACSDGRQHPCHGEGTASRCSSRLGPLWGGANLSVGTPQGETKCLSSRRGASGGSNPLRLHHLVYVACHLLEASLRFRTSDQAQRRAHLPERANTGSPSSEKAHMIQQKTAPRDAEAVASLRVVTFAHPQGCRSFLLNDSTSGQTLALDVHLDLVDSIAERVRSEGWSLSYVVDSHTHADHPSGAGALAELFSSTRIAHEKAGHAGVSRHPADEETLHLGDQAVTVYHCPGHTLDHMVLVTTGALFSGDTLLIGGVARTDFLGGDAGDLFDSIHRLLSLLPDETLLYPSHDYNGHTKSSLGAERKSNPWLQIVDRAEFVRSLNANPPPRPANMDALLRLNREGVEIPREVTVAEAIEGVQQGGSPSVLDVRTDVEFQSEHIDGSVQIPLDQLAARADEARAVPAPRLLLCRTGSRAEMARESLSKMGLAGLSVVSGGLEAYRSAGGETVRSGEHMSLERQVRILAGAVVVAGVGLGYMVHPFFFALAGLIGAGLVVAGVTDWCGMGLMLAKMPWNRGSTSERASGASGTCAANAPGTCAATPPAAGTCAAQPPVV
jgi:glyoxylase-like metal-dependent hydrolase (beta-lactamase superfamily II)/rhodanese-related sulfurtransferase